MSSSSSQLVTSRKAMSKEGSKIYLTFSGNDLRNQVKMQRFHSDIHLCLAFNRIHVSMREPKLKNSWSFKAFKFHLPGSFVPKCFLNFLSEPQTSKETNVGDNHAESDEMDVEDKRGADWVERIMQIRTCCIAKQQADVVDNDSFACEGCDEDGEKCEVDSSEDGVKGKKEIDRETFSKLIKEGSWSDTKLLSQSAFLCNMAYAISEMMVCFVYFVLNHFNRSH